MRRIIEQILMKWECRWCSLKDAKMCETLPDPCRRIKDKTKAVVKGIAKEMMKWQGGVGL